MLYNNTWARFPLLKGAAVLCLVEEQAFMPNRLVIHFKVRFTVGILGRLPLVRKLRCLLMRESDQKEWLGPERPLQQ
jgi:hypothetical protein